MQHVIFIYNILSTNLEAMLLLPWVSRFVKEVFPYCRKGTVEQTHSISCLPHAEQFSAPRDKAREQENKEQQLHSSVKIILI